MKSFHELDEFAQADLTNNKSYEELQFMYDVCRDGLRRLFSRHLMGYDLDNPYEEQIMLVEHESFGLSSLQIPHVERMYMDQVEGMIYIKFDYMDEFEDFDNVPIETLLEIAYKL